jgi:hypothetical protein
VILHLGAENRSSFPETTGTLTASSGTRWLERATPLPAESSSWILPAGRASRLEYVPPFSVALVCVGLGQNEEAVQWLSKAYDAHNKLALYARTDPSLDPLRSNLRFDELLRRSGLQTTR